MSSDEAFEQAIVDKAGKIQGEMEKLAGDQSSKADKTAEKLKRAYLTAAAKSAVWGEIVTAIEDGTQEDPEEFADTIGLSLEEFSKSNAKTLIKRLAQDGAETVGDLIGSDGLDSFLDLSDTEFLKLVDKVRI